jgi:ribosomal protein S18 acetylase RimI-like enzyme
MISTAEIKDVPQLNILINSAYRGETSKKGWTTEANLLEGSRTNETELIELLSEQNNTILKYSEEDQILACVLLIEKKIQLYLGMLTVSPSLQNSGIGKKLLNAAEIHAKKMNLSSIVMTVISVRTELISWYMRHGYKDTGAREPFPIGTIHVPITTESLEFMVLEKTVI